MFIFDILIYVYKKEFGYEALTQLIKRYNLATLKYLQGETKPCYVITDDEIDQIFEKEKIELTIIQFDGIVITMNKPL